MDRDPRTSAVVFLVKHTVIGAPVIGQNRRLIFDVIAVIALAVGPDLIEFGWLVANGQRGKLVHVRMYRELVLVEKINAPCWKLAAFGVLSAVMHAWPL